jgi:steroid 5-alpha reductase family enzyme
MAAWIYFGGGTGIIPGWLGGEPMPAGDLLRRMVLISFSVVLFGRMNFTLFYLLKRRFGWEEVGGVLFALFVYQIVFALLGGREPRPVGVLEILAIAMFLVGSYFNTGSELQRKRFKDKPEHQGLLFTQGLFR